MNNVWDKLAMLHYQQLKDGKDITFHEIFLPVILNFIKRDDKFDTYNVLDFGCGTGYLTGLVSQYARSVIGLDTSMVSIEIAKQHNKDIRNVNFDVTSIKSYAKSHSHETDFLLAHLVFHVVEDFLITLKSISNCLKKGGDLLFAIPHPCFWAISNDVGTWNFLNTDSYKYSINSDQQNIINIGGEKFVTPHYHRTLEYYISCLVKTGFTIKEMVEPIPENELLLRYNKKPWPFPRFLFIICRKEYGEPDGKDI